MHDFFANQTTLRQHQQLLVVEDNETIGVGLCQFFEKKNFQVTLAPSLACAKRSLNQSRFDVILLDHDLGDGLGVQLLETGSHAPIVFLMTGNSSLKFPAYYAHGAAVCFRKPFEPDDVLAAIERYTPKRCVALEKLTAREREILKLINDGYSSIEVAGAIGLSPQTVAGYRKSIKTKFGGLPFISICGLAYPKMGT